MQMLLLILSAFFVIFSSFGCVCELLLDQPLENVRTNLSNVRKIEGKIVGGEAVSIERYPFAVQFLNMGRLCGGVIINSWSILTAAHCIEFNTDMDQMVVQVGAKYTYDFNSDRYRVLSFTIHEDYYREQPFSCDIALVFVKNPIKLGARAKKGVLVNHGRWMNEREREFIVTGWGFTKTTADVIRPLWTRAFYENRKFRNIFATISQTATEHEGEVSKVGLQSTHLHYVTPNECSCLLKGHELTQDMFCLYGDGQRDTCQGDSGGGVLWNGMLVGLTSHGDGCASKNKPSVYTNLWVLRKWIIKSVEDFIEEYCNHRFRPQL